MPRVRIAASASPPRNDSFCSAITNKIRSVFVPAYASNERLSSNNTYQISSFSFLDGEGKNNTAVVCAIGAQGYRVDYYIEGELINQAEITAIQETDMDSLTGTGNDVKIVFTDCVSGVKREWTESLSDTVCELGTILIPADQTRSYAYEGCIKYNTYHCDGTDYSDSLYYFQEYVGLTYDYRVFNANEGDLVSVLIGILASVLSSIFIPFCGIAGELFNAIVSSVGATIVGGYLQNAISKTYYARIYDYNVKACDFSTSRETYYQAEKLRIALPGGGYSSNYYFNGNMPWYDNYVAYSLFCDF